MRPYNLLIFDLDGVITTEHIYWECARLTVWELLQRLTGKLDAEPVHNATVRETIIPQETIFAFKNRAINSNWDLTFMAACILLQAVPALSIDTASVQALLHSLNAVSPVEPIVWPEALQTALTQTSLSGTALINNTGAQLARHMDVSAAFFRQHGPWWHYLFDRFQRWYNGEAMREWGGVPLRETPAIRLEIIHDTLKQLRQMGYTLAIATGRPYAETVKPLTDFGVLDFFATDRVITYDDVVAAQTATGENGLGKPHPFILRKAIDPGEKLGVLLGNQTTPHEIKSLMIGDSTSDALAAKAAGIPCAGVLTGVKGKTATISRQNALSQAGCLAVLPDASALPAWLQSQSAAH